MASACKQAEMAGSGHYAPAADALTENMKGLTYENERDWCAAAAQIGFDKAIPVCLQSLTPLQAVRDMCAENRCGAYGRNWMCPPESGTLEDCAAQIAGYSNGILLQTIGHMEKAIDTKAYLRTEQKHLAQFRQLAEQIRAVHPQALCLGSGGCRVCKRCAYPEPCRFPQLAYGSMEGYGLLVSRVCKANGLSYYYGERTIAYTACILF